MEGALRALVERASTSSFRRPRRFGVTPKINALASLLVGASLLRSVIAFGLLGLIRRPGWRLVHV
jgi:hypothetical protein